MVTIAHNIYNCIRNSAELGFFLNGTFLSDNSIVLLSDIGEGSNALFCLTNSTQCCMAEQQGQWMFPDGSNVHSSSENFNQTRGFSSLLLNRRRSAMGPTGIFKCEIPDQTEMNLYVGVYDNVSEGVLSMFNLSIIVIIIIHMQPLTSQGIESFN